MCLGGGGRGVSVEGDGLARYVLRTCKQETMNAAEEASLCGETTHRDDGWLGVGTGRKVRQCDIE